MAELPRGSHVGVLSSLFPSSVQPNSGLFVRERMFRVARRLPLFVVAPTPWFPYQEWIREYWKKPYFRPGAPEYEEQQGIPVWYPRFLSVPGVFKNCDGWTMALAAHRRFAAMRHAGHLDLIDAHFGYPDGYAAILIGRRLGVPVTITLRGSEVRLAHDPFLGPKLREALMGATKVFTVCESLRQFAVDLGVPGERAEVIGNGVDAGRFRPRDRNAARAALGVPLDAPVLISVGWLVEGKGYHRVIEVLPELVRRWPGLVYLIVGGGSPAGNDRAALEAQIERLGLKETVRFLGELPPGDLPGPLSAADVFVLATRSEGWANVFLEAMACGLPVVTTDVGGNREVVSRPELGVVVPFGEPLALEAALDRALSRPWDRAAIRRYAESNSWDGRIDRLCRVFTELTGRTARE
ncbi:MAG: glycosyltransferase family 4 protein [Azoarcus sp.]|jgi:glycosyltransferase involved in cell wall biosynthesis|nr:glycosyltransferase family 4 protein [Azoarcus sp.]